VAAAESVETVEKLATEWVRARTETARLEAEWGRDRGLMDPMLSALRERARAAEEKKDTLLVRTAKDREELGVAQTVNESTATELKTAASRVEALMPKLTAMRASLPPRLSAALELPFKSLSAPDLPMGERMQFTMTILNRCVQFNRVITCGEEAVVIDGESAPLVLEVIYWGLSHGYALDRSGNRVWLGAPGAGSWHWESRVGATEAVARLIDIHQGKADPEFVLAPARLAPDGEAKPVSP
jgi:hypothetical protein